MSLYMLGYLPVVLIQRHLASQINLMLDDGCLSQVQVAVGKQVFPFSQQLPGLFLFIHTYIYTYAHFGPKPQKNYLISVIFY